MEEEQKPKKIDSLDEDNAEDVIKNITDFLDDKWSKESQICPICKKDEWIIMGKIFEYPEPHAMTKKSYSSFPVGLVMCHNCGYTHSFNYILIKKRLAEQKKAVGEKNEP